MEYGIWEYGIGIWNPLNKSPVWLVRGRSTPDFPCLTCFQVASPPLFPSVACQFPLEVLQNFISSSDALRKLEALNWDYISWKNQEINFLQEKNGMSGQTEYCLM